MTPLQKLVIDRRAELQRPYRQVEERSGGLVSRSTLNKIERGIHSGRFDDDTLRGIALGLDLALTQVREAAGKSRDEPTEFRLPDKARQLTDAERRAILKMVDALLEAHQDGPG